MQVEEYIRGKKVLVMGLGLLGGGTGSVRWLVKHGALVTVTDLRNKDILGPSLEVLRDVQENVTFVLGEHKKEDFEKAEIVVANPGVPQASPYLIYAREQGTPIENEASLFFKFCPTPIIGITGTRGKTTTATWTHYFLKGVWPGAVLTGNVAQVSLLAVLDDLTDKVPVVAELSSFQLELLPQAERSPHVAVVTNIMRDHLNRHATMEKYVDAKANIFKYQTKEDVFILRKDNEWTDYMLAKKPTHYLFSV